MRLDPPSTTALADLMAAPEFQARAGERQQLVLQAKPIYVAMLCSVPFYKAREHDEHFWAMYIGSRVTEAQALVAQAAANPS